MKILVVEDDPLAADLLVDRLGRLGHEGLVVVDGVEAMDTLKTVRPRIIVSDWKLPRCDGIELCGRIRSECPDYVYFILLTGTALTDESYETAFAGGVDDCLSKDADQRELRSRLRVAERVLKATAQVARAGSVLPMCSHCKRVRSGQDSWEQIETFLKARDGTRVSHGVCPDCYRDHMAPALQKFGIDPPKYPRHW